MKKENTEKLLEMLSRGGNGEKKHKNIVENDEQRWEWREETQKYC